MKNYIDYINNVREVYSWLHDETSRQLFLNRLEFNAVYNENFMELENNTSCINVLKKMWVFSSGLVQKFLTTTDHMSDEKIASTDFDVVVLYGAGKRCNKIAEKVLKSASKVVVCDKNYNEIKEVNIDNNIKLPVISPQEATKTYNSAVFLITPYDMQVQQDMKDTLLSYGVDEKQISIYSMYYYDAEKQYFDEDIIKLNEDEIFIDGGAFDGSTSRRFSEKCGGKYKKIYTFEPDALCIENVRKGIKDLKNIHLYELGLWDKKDVLRFKVTGGGDSSLNCTGNTEKGNFIEVNVSSVDNILNGNPASFIKMDIEGAELKALQGAKNTIQKYKPKLAICIYHKPEDIFEIPQYIKGLVPEYKFFIRHYSSSLFETVLYAIV